MQVDLRRRGLQSFNPAEFANSDEHLQLLLQVRQLDLSFNSLYTIRGLEGLTHLTVLNISNNGLRSLGGGLPLTLTELDASHNCLGSLQDAALLPLQSLTSLNVSFNNLADLRGVPNATAQLAYLDARSNRLSSLQGIEHCAQLLTLHAEANLLREVADVASLKCLPRLTAVFLAGNPILLRKRLLHQVRLLLPPSVDQDDVPTTAPPSSVRSSTAPPPSIPATSSMGSLENSTSVSCIGDRDDEHEAAAPSARNDTSHRSSRPASVHQSGLSLAVPHRDGTYPAAYSKESTAVVPTAKRSGSGLAVATSRPPVHAVSSTVAATATGHPAIPGATSNSSGVGVLVGVVGGDKDSPTCPRRALPHEHRLGDSPASANSISPVRGGGGGPTSSATVPATATSTSIGASRAAPPPPGLSAPSRPRTTTHISNLAPEWRPERQMGSVGSRGTTRRLSREELEEQLVRTMAERDAYRRETIALRKEVADLQQLLAARDAEVADAASPEAPQHFSELMPSAFSDPRSATLNSMPSPIPSRTVLSIDGSQLGDAPGPLANRPPSRVLAVEMSGHSSTANSEDGRRKVGGAVDPSLRPSNARVGRSIPVDRTAMPSASDQPRKPALASVTDRRAVAALFMSKLQSSSAKKV
jgi:hypothetical protein